MASGYSSPLGQSADNSWICTSPLETPERGTSQDTPSSPQEDWMFVKSGQTPETPVLRKLPSQIVKSETITKRPRGRKSKQSLFPDIIPKAKSIIEEHGYEADSKRRVDTARSSGISLQQVRDKLYEDVPGLKEHGLHPTTLHHMMVPPNKKFKAAVKYSADINAKVASKKNAKREMDKNAHYYFARIRYAMEFASKYKSECVAISCDNKNKVHIGTLAVSRYHQLKKLYPCDDMPNYRDHDFPLPGCLITPCGYMELHHPDGSKDNTNTDSIGRKHFVTSRTGPLYIINRISSFHKSTIETHVNDLLPIIKDRVDSGKTTVLLLTDNGPDWNVNSIANVLFLVRLWKASNLDALLTSSFCPKYSAFNPIEHSWSPCSDALAGVELPAVIPGESKPPSQQNLSHDDKKKKEVRVFDHAMSRLDEYWNNISYDGFKVSSCHQSCLTASEPYSDYEYIHKKLQMSATHIRQNADIMAELQFCMKHIDRRIHCLYIVKCDSKTCDHCSVLPKRAKTAVTFLKDHRGLPSPMPDESHEGHFLTFMDSMTTTPGERDLHMSKYVELGLGRCPACPSYSFVSKTEKDKHMKIFHKKVRNLILYQSTL